MKRAAFDYHGAKAVLQKDVVAKFAHMHNPELRPGGVKERGTFAKRRKLEVTVFSSLRLKISK